MNDNKCLCFCGREWGKCADSMKCLRELRAEEAERETLRVKARKSAGGDGK